MHVDERTFIDQHMPLCHLALVVHAMYYGEGEYGNQGRMSSTRIREALGLPDKQAVFRLLDMADDMLGNGTRQRRIRA